MPKIYENSDDFNRDRYGNNVEATSRYFKQRKNDIDIKPIENEPVESYTRRIASKIKAWEEINIEAHIYGRKMWYTHKLASGCWICDGITMLWNLYDTYNLLSETLPDGGKLHVFHYDNNKLTIVDNSST